MQQPMTPSDLPKQDVIARLNRLLAFELGTIPKYLHFAVSVYGPSRPILRQWFLKQAQESLEHATEIGDWITTLGGHPTLASRPASEADVRHSLRGILTDCAELEQEGLTLYRDLFKLVQDRDIALEDWVRSQYRREQEHLSEVSKMLKNWDLSFGSNTGTRAVA